MNYSDTFIKTLLEQDDINLDDAGDAAALNQSMDSTADKDQYSDIDGPKTSPEDIINKLTTTQAKWKESIKDFREFVTDVENNDSLVKQIIKMESFPAFDKMGDKLLDQLRKVDEILAVVDSRLTGFHQEAQRNYDNYVVDKKTSKG